MKFDLWYLWSIWGLPCAGAHDVQKVGYFIESHSGGERFGYYGVGMPGLTGATADVKIWDKYLPLHTKACFIEFEAFQKMLRSSGSTRMNIHASLIHPTGRAQNA